MIKPDGSKRQTAYGAGISRFILIFMQAVFAAGFAVIFLCTCFFNNSDTEFRMIPQLLSMLIGGGVVFLIVWVTKKWMLKNSSLRKLLLYHSNGFLFGILALIFLIQLLMITQTYTSFGWDVGLMVTTSQTSDMVPLWESYFSHYPNNLLLLFFFRIVFQVSNVIFGAGNYSLWLILAVINALAVDAAVMLTFFTVKRLFDLKRAYLSVLFCVLLFAFFPWILVPYSDTLAMPFVMLLLLLLLRQKAAIKDKAKILYSVIIGIVMFVAYYIKPTTIIIIIAFGLTELIKGAARGGEQKGSRKGILNAVLRVAIIGLVFAVCNQAFNLYIYNYQTYTPLDQEIAFPVTYWIMSGLSNPRGMCIARYQIMTTGQINTDAMRAVHWAEIHVRLQELGPFGYVKFLFAKLRWITSEGHFFWGGEGEFAEFDFTRTNFFKEFYYVGGRYYNQFLSVVQGIWLLILGLLAVPIGRLRNRENEKTEYVLLMMRLTIIGILLFLLIFEARSRYLILYLPCFAILASCGMEELSKRFKRRTGMTEEKEKENHGKAAKKSINIE